MFLFFEKEDQLLEDEEKSFKLGSILTFLSMTNLLMRAHPFLSNWINNPQGLGSFWTKIENGQKYILNEHISAKRRALISY